VTVSQALADALAKQPQQRDQTRWIKLEIPGTNSSPKAATHQVSGRVTR
jgi:hypothetical protein